MTAAENQPPPMTQKTAIMQLIDNLIYNKENFHPMSYGHFMNELVNKLATEKEHIIKTHDDGYNEGLLETGIHGEQYYEQTFGNSPSPSK